MIELALHILDIVENSIRAGAALVEINVKEDVKNDILSIEITDNGSGMDRDTLEKALDPFFTTKTVRKIGLGLSMLKQACEMTDGSFSIDSTPGKGTKVKALFLNSHIDRQPLGDMAGVITALILESPDTDIVYTHSKGSEEYILDTRGIREGLDGTPLNHPEVINLIRSNITEGLAEI